MADPILYRKRLIPEECVLLKDDRLLYRDEEIIVTAWNTLKPRKDLHHGRSCYYLREGITPGPIPMSLPTFSPTSSSTPTAS